MSKKKIGRQLYSIFVSSAMGSRFYHAELPTVQILLDTEGSLDLDYDDELQETAIVGNFEGLAPIIDNINRTGSSITPDQKRAHEVLGMTPEEFEEFKSCDIQEKINRVVNLFR